MLHFKCSPVHTQTHIFFLFFSHFCFCTPLFYLLLDMLLLVAYALLTVIICSLFSNVVSCWTTPLLLNLQKCSYCKMSSFPNGLRVCACGKISSKREDYLTVLTLCGHLACPHEKKFFFQKVQLLSKKIKPWRKQQRRLVPLVSVHT